MLRRQSQRSPPLEHRPAREGVAEGSLEAAREERAMVALSILELKKAQSCEEKKVIVVKLKGLGDTRALPAVRALRGRSLGPLRFGGADTRCMRAELAETISALEEKDGVKPPTRRTRRGR